jgi:hypothetical protein
VNFSLDREWMPKVAKIKYTTLQQPRLVRFVGRLEDTVFASVLLIRGTMTILKVRSLVSRTPC